ncbi:MAG: fibronectin type III domain-containing protein, partial [Actinobacteria bacterium]|nr:fibronectin type III domain-containing protein [Actinomycetota bacterium]
IVPEDGVAVTQHSLTTNVVGEGTVSASPDKVAYDDGEEVTLTATPASGSVFDGWSGDLTGTANPQTLTMNADKSVTATFSAETVDTVDTTAPTISNVAVAAGSSSATVTWTTDEPADSAVAYGPTSAYENGSVVDPTLVTSHSLTLTGLSPETLYHFAVTSVDGAANATSTPDATFTTTAPGPVIDVWYGSHQVFGERGQSQTWVNILGNVSVVDGISSLHFSLNGGPSSALSIGPDKRRLDAPGDFNVEIAYSDLKSGLNDVVITATDDLGQTSVEGVTVDYRAGITAALPYTTDWGSAVKIADDAQVVDGLWALDGDSVRSIKLGYDRLITLGDLSWQDYEVTVPVTVYGLGPGAGTPESGAPLVGLALRWQGHTPRDSEQPAIGFYPTGAFAWYRWSDPARFELTGNDGSPVTRASSPTLSFGVPYVFKARVETVAGGTRYDFKVWEANATEPAEWLLSIEEDAGPATGSVGLIAHHADARFGNVSVTPLVSSAP